MRTGLKLLIIIALCELVIMALFQWLDIESATSPWVETVTDPVLLALLASYPIYKIIVHPLASLALDAQSGLRKMVKAVEASAAGIIITDCSGVIEYANPAFVKITGYSVNELLGNTPAILKSGEQDETFYSHFWHIISSGNPWSGRVVDKAKDGHIYPVRMTVSPITNDDNEITHYVAIHEDVSEQEALENQLAQAQKMDAMGTLVAGIAHDFNNMLASIVGNCYLAESHVNDPHQVSEKLRRIRKQSEQSGGLIRQLLIFARHESIQMKALPLASLIKESLKLQRASVPENVELRSDISDATMRIRGDSIQLQQALLNLINNAVHALEGRASPFIRVKLTDISCSDLPPGFRPKAKAVRFAYLVVEDNGCGIAEEHRKKLFEPFFTTKGRGKGTGLGLAMTYGAIQAHEGFIEVQGEKDVGTSFHIYLPLLDAKEQEKDGLNENGMMPQGMGETILLADDNAKVLESMREMLESMGYHVITAADGEEAIHLFESNQDTVDALLFDMAMPAMNGVEAAWKVRRINPGIPVVFVSGYEEDHISDIPSGFGSSCILSKPFSPLQLGCTLRKLLDA